MLCLMDTTLKQFKHLSGFGLPALLFVMLVMMVFPLPATLLDGLFSLNLAFTLFILLNALSLKHPLRFSALPSILLTATLLRLALTVATTRALLLHGHLGVDAAGTVIARFGHWVVGEDHLVGLCVFLILLGLIIAVVMKATGCMFSEGRHFLKNKLPAQMTRAQAKGDKDLLRSLKQRVRFHQDLQLASQLMRLEAIACVLIIGCNFMFGTWVGMREHGMSQAVAFDHYSALTIGDALVALVPALFLALAGAIAATRLSTLSTETIVEAKTFLIKPQVLGVLAIFLSLLGSLPGMPHVIFLGLILIAACAYLVLNVQAKHLHACEKEACTVCMPQITIEVGLGGLALLTASHDNLLTQLAQWRQQRKQACAAAVPPVTVRDNLSLASQSYRILVDGHQVKTGVLKITAQSTAQGVGMLLESLTQVCEHELERLLQQAE